MRMFNLGHRELLSFPFTTETMAKLGPTRLVSPRVGNSHGIQLPPMSVFESQLSEVRDASKSAKIGVWPSGFYAKHTGTERISPILTQMLGLTESNPMRMVTFLSMDHPLEFYDRVVEPWAIKKGIKVRDAGPGIPFLNTVRARTNAHRIIWEALNKAFDVKYFYGVLRPCEMFDISLENIPTPTHPSFVAGHGAFMGASVAAFELLWDATPEQVKDVELAGLQLAHGRTLAGVHYPIDNEVGFKIGRTITK